jgi:hypothetical protein
MRHSGSYAGCSKMSAMLSAIAEKADPAKAAERAENVRAFEQKQEDAAKRAADLEERRKDAPRRAQENKAGTQLQ